MNIRKVKRKCGMRGCKCTESYALSLTNEMGNSIIACKSCLVEAAKAVENYKEGVKPERKVSREAPPLFFNAKAMGKKPEQLPEAEPLIIEDKETAEALVEALEESAANADEAPTSKTKPTTTKKKSNNKKE